MEMTTVKTIAVFAIIFGCFAVLYPKIFHPMLLHLFGMAPEKKSTNDELLNKMPPHLRKGPGAARAMGGMDDVASHLKPGPHPGLRAAAEMKKQAATTTPGGGKGMMSVVLPMYAIGIVIYLIYTLTKVFGKRDTVGTSENYPAPPFSEISYDADKQKFRCRGDDDDLHASDGEDEDFKQFRKRKQQQRDLERLLLKADKNEISERELKDLKRRLMETEMQMSRILQAMGTVESKLGHVVGEDGEAHQSPISEHPQVSTEDLEQILRAQHNPEHFQDLSPDMESYEIISGANSSRSKNGNGNQDTDEEIEEIGAQCIEEDEDVGMENEDNVEDNEENIEDADDNGEEEDGRNDGDHREDSEDQHDEADEESVEEEEISDEIIPSLEDVESDDEHPNLRHRNTAEHGGDSS